MLCTIALGVGSNVAVQAFIEGFTKQTPLAGEGDAVLSVFSRGSSGVGSGPVPYDDYLSVKQDGRWFEWVGAARVRQKTVTVDGRPSVKTVASVTEELGRLAGMKPGLYLDEPVDVWTTFQPGEAKGPVWVLGKAKWGGLT